MKFFPIFTEVFERVLYNFIFRHFPSKVLLNKFQSGFLLADSWIYQVFLIIHEVQLLFNSNQFNDVRGVFLDISKVFDKVWHEGLTFKLSLMDYEVICCSF